METIREKAFNYFKQSQNSYDEDINESDVIEAYINGFEEGLLQQDNWIPIEESPEEGRLCIFIWVEDNCLGDTIIDKLEFIDIGYFTHWQYFNSPKPKKG